MFKIQFSRFFQGFAPLAHLDTLTELGNKGHASSMLDCDVLGENITQGPTLANLTGTVDQLIVHILDKAVANNTTYGISATKTFPITATSVSTSRAISGAVAGRSLAYLKGKLFYFFERTSDSAIGSFDLTSTYNDTWQVGLEKADLIPVATKEDIMIFGHGSKVGVYFDDDASMTLDRLDFGANHEVVDIVFHGNQWLVAVNSGVAGTNRNSSQIYAYEGGATENILSDEVAIGLQKIGFIMPINGVVYVCYQDLTGGFKIGYLAGRKIEPLVSFTGSLPNHRQKTLFNNTILFASSGKLYTAGALAPELPYAISQHAPGGLATVGAVSAPFGTPLIASTHSTSYQLAKFTGYSKGNWKSITHYVSAGKKLGYIDYIEVFTKTLATGAKCELKLELNQASVTTTAYEIIPGKTKHIFNVNKGGIEDLKLFLDWSDGSATNPCTIRKVVIYGHTSEK